MREQPAERPKEPALLGPSVHLVAGRALVKRDNLGRDVGRIKGWASKKPKVLKQAADTDSATNSEPQLLGKTVEKSFADPFRASGWPAKPRLDIKIDSTVGNVDPALRYPVG